MLLRLLTPGKLLPLLLSLVALFALYPVMVELDKVRFFRFGFLLVLMLAVYSLGLAIPFLLTALAFTRMTSVFGIVKRNYRAIMAFGGAVLIVMGVLVYTGELFRLNVESQQLLNDLGINLFNQV